jgi:hypothetical protein
MNNLLPKPPVSRKRKVLFWIIGVVAALAIIGGIQNALDPSKPKAAAAATHVTAPAPSATSARPSPTPTATSSPARSAASSAPSPPRSSSAPASSPAPVSSSAPPPPPPASSPPAPAPTSASSAWCSATASVYDASKDWNNVYVHSNQPYTSATASADGYSWSYETDGSGYALIYLNGPPPGATITVTVGGAACTTSD